MLYRSILLNICLVSAICEFCKYKRFLPNNETFNERCLSKILARVFKKTPVEFVNFTFWSFQENAAMIVNDYESKSPLKNIAIQSNFSQISNVTNHFGYDKNILFIIPYMLVSNYEELFLDAWFKFRTKVAVVTFSNDTCDLITNIYNKNYDFCPNMKYKFFRNVCSDDPKRSSIKVNAEKYCHIKISYIKVHPFVNDVTKKNGGVMVSWMKTYGNIRGIDISFIKNNDDYQEEFLNNGTFHKLVADLNQRKQDVAIGQLFMNSSDQFPVDFGPLIFIDKLGFIHRRFRSISDYRKMIIIFDKSVWTYILVTFCIFVPVYNLMIYLLENYALLPTVVVTDIFRLILGSGIPNTPVSLSSRILFTTFCMFAITINSTYVGKLSEIFTNPPADKREDIFDHGVRIHISWVIERITLISYYVNKRVDTRQKKGAGNSISNKSDQELLRAVAWTQTNGTGTFLSTLLSNPTERELVYFRTVDDLLVNPRVTYYISKWTPLKDSLQYWTNEIFEKGFLHKWVSDAIPPKNYSMLKEETEDIVLKMAHFEIVFQMLFCGYTFAFITLLLEIVYKKLDVKYHVTENIIYIVSFLKPPPELKIDI